jgi:hypothetical protein
MQYIKNSTFMNFLRHNAKATAKCSRPCENIIRSFVNGGADLSGGSLYLHTPPEALEYSSRLGGGSNIMCWLCREAN